MHTLLDYDGNLPVYVNITDGKTADNKGAYDVPLHKGSVIVADRFYNDFSLLNVWDSNQVFFVVRHKENLQYTTIKDENPETLVLISPAFAAAGPLAPTVATAYANALQQDARQMHIGYKLTSGVHTVVIAYNRLDDKRPNNADTTSYGTTYTFALSKRTNLNAVLTRFNNTGSGQAAPGGGGFLGGVTSAAGVGSTNVAFGIRHTF